MKDFQLKEKILPETTDIVNIGALTRKFKNLYLSGSITADTATFSGTVTADKVKATTNSVVLRRDSGDYGGNFSTYTPPSGEEGLIIIANDTNSTSPGHRIYIYSGGAWHYVDLT